MKIYVIGRGSIEPEHGGSNPIFVLYADEGFFTEKDRAGRRAKELSATVVELEEGSRYKTPSWCPI